MKKTSILIAVLLIVITGIFIFRQQQHGKYIAQVVLAKELNKSMSAMMGDFVQEKAEGIQNVPTDGEWRDSIWISSSARGDLKYSVSNHRLMRSSSGREDLIAENLEKVLFRRLKENPEVLEVQVESKNAQKLKSNFRVRLKV